LEYWSKSDPALLVAAGLGDGPKGPDDFAGPLGVKLAVALDAM
jgi:hypothetical protein